MIPKKNMIYFLIILTLSILGIVNNGYSLQLWANAISAFNIDDEDGVPLKASIINPVISIDGLKIAFIKNDETKTEYLCLLKLKKNPKKYFCKDKISLLRTKIFEEIIITNMLKKKSGKKPLINGYSFSYDSKQLFFGTLSDEDYAINLFDIEKKSYKEIYKVEKKEYYSCSNPKCSPYKNIIAFTTSKGGTNKSPKLCLLTKKNKKWMFSYHGEKNTNDSYFGWSQFEKNKNEIAIVSAKDTVGKNYISIFDIKNKTREVINNTDNAAYPIWSSSTGLFYYLTKGNNESDIIFTRKNDDKIEKKNEKFQVSLTESGPCYVEEPEYLKGLYCIAKNFKNTNLPLIKISNGKASLIIIKGRQNKKLIRKPLRNTKYIIWNKSQSYFVAVGDFHKSGNNYLYVLYDN